MTPLADLLVRLRARGIDLRVEQGELRFRAPKGAFTPDLRAEAKARAEELIAHLTAATRPRQARMSMAQERIWFLYRLEGPSSTYSITPVFRLTGPLSQPALRAAFNALAERHETLRMRFAEVDGVGVQIVDPPGEVPIEVVSLAHIPSADRLARAEQIVLEETARPFDLERSHALRVTLIALDDEDHLLLPFMHHIIADGWSLGVMQRELNQHYAVTVRGAQAALPPLTTTYAEFAAGQRAAQHSDAGRDALAWWVAHLDGAPQALALPLDAERPAMMTFNGRVLHRLVPPEIASAITACGRAQGCSLFMTLLAAYGVLLFRHSAQTDLLIGSPVAGRSRPELEALIGCFVNTLVLRLRIEPGASFTDLLRQVRQTALDAYARQEVPIESVIDAVATDRDPSRMPLFQAQLSLQNVPITAGTVSGLRVEPMRMDRVAAKNDLSFILDSRGDEGIGAEVEFNTDLFRQETVEDLWSDYVGLLKQLADAPETTLTDLLRTPGVIEGRLKPAPTSEPGPTFDNLVSWFDAVVERQPDAEAVCDDTTSLTFAGLRERADAIAEALRALALSPAAPVAVLMGRSVELIASILGVLESGAPYLPLSPDHPEERLQFMLSHAGARAIVTDASCEPLAARLAAACGVEVIRADAQRAGAIRDRTPPAPADLAYIIFTSGSTGRPKGVMIEHRSVVNLVRGLGEIAYDTAGHHLRVALIASPVFDASVQQIFGTLLHGHTLCIVPEEARRDGARLGDWLHAMRVDASDGTPTLLRLLVDTGFGTRPTTLRHMLIGGEPLPSDLVAALHARPQGRDMVVTNVYGPTECCVDVVARRLTATDAPTTAAVAPIGQPMPGCMAAIVDDEGRLVPTGIAGELVIGGECVGRGYVNDPALTAERFMRLTGTGDARVYRTGDLCRLRRDGDIEFLGRNDDQVKVLGHRIELGEVEHHLRAHPSVAAVSVQARQTRKGYRELVAYIVARGRLEAIELRAFAAARMPDYMIPAYFVPLDKLPVNTSGKVSRQDLPNPETSTLLPSGAEYRDAATEAEAALVAAWTHTLNRAPDGVRDNYFTSGGDSIKALQLASRLRDTGWMLEIRDLFKHPTIEQLAPHLRRHESTPAAEQPRSGRARLGAIQRFFFDTYGPATAFNQAILLKVQRPLDVSRLEAACTALMAHHGMLRCRFVREDAGWMQEVLDASACTPLVDRIDLRTAAAPADELARHAAAEQLRFALEQAPLWSAVLYDMPGGQRLLLTAHHLIVDGVSWRILLEDLDRLLSQPGQPLPAPTASYAAWVSHQQRAVETALLPELPRWERGTAPASPGRQADRRRISGSLSAEVTADLLTRAHQAYATEINDLLLTALARAWTAWTGSRSCAITVEGHGREPLGEPIDVSRTVGWFTSMYPLEVELPADADPGLAIKLVKNTLRAIPNKGAGYMVLRQMSDAGDRLGALPPLAFNYLGRFDAAGDSWFAPAPEPGPVTALPDLAAPWPLEVTAVVVDGRLDVTLSYAADGADADGAPRFLSHILAQLDAVVGHTCGRTTTELTSADFDYAGLSEQQLDDFLGTI